ncbi:UDP-N-acetylbacillosamine N-acetyltransferase [Planococcus massiliensis]|uniref:UDP-N-acetylbacillosamine N-acetyltransferase n=1 Tax=Planococcus massiliensis TaxID=1499687 RepID=A0A098EJN6_9BACL|nr:acetyltransferase [Planococcus massiliensis]CEG22027.1 UDP-N-acetylbacillosamine N-acetyltransferase [Planococcus massiliensis]
MNESAKQNLLIIGASGHGKVVADTALKMNKWQRIAFLDDDESLKVSLGFDIIGTSKDIEAYINDWDIFVAIGNNTIREKIQVELQAQGATFPILIHPSAAIGKEVEIAEGTVIMAGVVINSSTKIGRGCIINTSATVDHDNLIEDFAHISPGVHLAGTVIIGKGTWIGIGSIVSNNLEIISGAILGAGAVVLKDINETGVYVGVPARRINYGKDFNTS